jgi:hypothetical protein
MLRGELPKPKLARVVHLAECVFSSFAGEQTRRFRERDPAALTRRQALQRGPERALARSRQPWRVGGHRVRGAEDFSQQVTNAHPGHPSHLPRAQGQRVLGGCSKKYVVTCFIIVEPREREPDLLPFKAWNNRPVSKLNRLQAILSTAPGIRIKSPLGDCSSHSWSQS